MRCLAWTGGAIVLALAVGGTARAQDRGTSWCDPACQWVAQTILAQRGTALPVATRARLNRLARSGSSQTTDAAKRAATYAFADALVRRRLVGLLRAAGKTAEASQVAALPVIRDPASATRARETIVPMQPSTNFELGQLEREAEMQEAFLRANRGVAGAVAMLASFTVSPARFDPTAALAAATAFWEDLAVGNDE